MCQTKYRISWMWIRKFVSLFDKTDNIFSCLTWPESMFHWNVMNADWNFLAKLRRRSDMKFYSSIQNASKQLDTSVLWDRFKIKTNHNHVDSLSSKCKATWVLRAKRPSTVYVQKYGTQVAPRFTSDLPLLRGVKNW